MQAHFKFSSFLGRMILKTNQETQTNNPKQKQTCPEKKKKRLFCVALASSFSLENILANILLCSGVTWQEHLVVFWCTWYVYEVQDAYGGALDSRWEDPCKHPSTVETNFY